MSVQKMLEILEENNSFVEEKNKVEAQYQSQKDAKLSELERKLETLKISKKERLVAAEYNVKNSSEEYENEMRTKTDKAKQEAKIQLANKKTDLSRFISEIFTK